MAEKIEELNIPKSAVLRIIKDALPEKTQLDKDVTSAISRCASMFILYITSLSQDEAKLANRKTITGDDILSALRESDFGDFDELLKKDLEVFRSNIKGKKSVSEVTDEDKVSQKEDD